MIQYYVRGDSMRLDKYLKVSRIIKRRPVAKEVADKGRIKVNGILAKSSTDLKVNDQIEVRFGNKVLTVKVLEMLDSTKKEDASKMYEIISETRIEEDD
jgi:ribosomal 50S subunit-recycling heat shock protein